MLGFLWIIPYHSGRLNKVRRILSILINMGCFIIYNNTKYINKDIEIPIEYIINVINVSDFKSIVLPS